MSSTSSAERDKFFSDQHDSEATLKVDEIVLSVVSDEAPNGIIVTLSDTLYESLMNVVAGGRPESLEVTASDLKSVKGIDTNNSIEQDSEFFEDILELVKVKINEFLTENTHLNFLDNNDTSEQECEL